ncbi:phage tail tape measure protein, partial [Streptomyces sp. NPDC090026]|uniref:phage tail tape measure protein n=1 Tax=Streptomyces sp. NPDC090026 TaxID=3365923 RepID=UPI00381D8715
MALVVGELVGFIRLDDGEVRPALTRTEGALNASGRRMASDADRAGERAGQALADGVGDGADAAADRVRGASGDLADAGRSAGAALGDGLQDTAAAGADDAVAEVGGRFERLKMLAAGAGLAAGAALAVGIAESLSQAQITAKLRAQLGATPAEAQRYGVLAGQLFAEGITVDFQTAADTIRHVMAAGLVPPGATTRQLKTIATGVSDLASTFDVDLGMAATAASGMIKNGLAKDGQQALDMLAHGLEGTGVAGEDLVETFSEYSPVFKAAGVSGATAMGLIKQAIQGGWVKDTDKMADALKEFSLRAVSDTEGVQDAFKALGLNAAQMGADVGAGGQRGEQAIGQVLAALSKMPASAERAMIVQELFGGPGEDLGAALFKLDVDKAAKSMDGAAGSAKKLGDGLRDNAAANVTQLKNSLQQGLVDIIGGQVVPALATFVHWARENSMTLQILAGVVGGVLVPVLVLMGVNATVAAARVVAAWVVSGATAISSAATQVASGASVVAGWVLMGTQALLQAARMAAAWVIALGPVGWVIAAIVAVAAI